MSALISSEVHPINRRTHAQRAEERLKRADIPEVEKMRLGRYPFAAGINPFIDSRKGTWDPETTMPEERRKLQQIGRMFEDLKSQGRVSTTDPRHIKRSDVQEFMVELRKVDPSFQQPQMRRLKQYLRFFKNYVIEDMKSDGIKLPKAHKKPIRAIDPHDLILIFATVKELEGWTGSVARGMLSLYFATGARPTELRLAHFEDLNLKKRTFFVRHPKGEGSWASPEIVNIIREDMVPMIECYLRERSEHLRGGGDNKATALFPNVLGKNGFYSANRFRMIKEKVAKESGVEFKLKDFRSTLTTVTINGDLSRLGAMSAQLRHESPNTTHKFYNKIERCVASKKLKDLWRETPVIVSDTPSIEPRNEITGYG